MATPKKNLTPKTPGTAPAEDQMPPQADAEQAAPAEDEVEVTPEIQALIDRKVAEAAGAAVRADRQAQKEARMRRKDPANLPTQEEAMEQMKKTGRSVLSQDGYVVPPKVVGRNPIN